MPREKRKDYYTYYLTRVETLKCAYYAFGCLKRFIILLDCRKANKVSFTLALIRKRAKRATR